MKKIIQLTIAGLFFTAVSTSMAETTASKTNLDTNWICTTNASSSSIDAEKATDAKMQKATSSAVDAFSFASSNCRDCTKITCSVQSK